MKRYDCQGGPLYLQTIAKAFAEAFPYGDRDDGRIEISAESRAMFLRNFVDAKNTPDSALKLYHVPIKFSDELKATMKFYNFDRPAHSAEIVNFYG